MNYTLTVDVPVVRPNYRFEVTVLADEQIDNYRFPNRQVTVSDGQTFTGGHILDEPGFVEGRLLTDRQRRAPDRCKLHLGSAPSAAG
ncbi:MAG: hypothetical protein R2724_20225 [Bryobacterales bacterium]